MFGKTVLLTLPSTLYVCAQGINNDEQHRQPPRHYWIYSLFFFARDSLPFYKSVFDIASVNEHPSFYIMGSRKNLSTLRLLILIERIK